jgi:Macrocin-O-methyltransferase (TylF)
MSDVKDSQPPDPVLTDAPPREVRVPAPRPDTESMRTAYLELLKLSLCDLVGAGTRTISWTGKRQVFARELTGADQLEWRIAGRDWPLNALTMVGLRRLDDLQACVESVVREGVEGDLIEAGTWRGGASILMRATLDSLGESDRTVWVADSFQGFPAPEADAVPEDRELETELGNLSYLAPSLDQVQGYFARFGLDHGVTFVPGFFEETMGQLRGRRWALIRLDADTYKATRLTLDALYPGLSVGGYLVSDDYAFLPACQRAIDEFRRQHDIAEPIEQIDFNGIRWRREQAGELPSGEPSEQPTAPPPRAANVHTVEEIPTDREIQLGEELDALEERLKAVEAKLEMLRGSPLAGPLAWWSQRRRRPNPR